MSSLVVRIPMKTVNELNIHAHWRGRQKRAKAQRGMTAFHLRYEVVDKTLYKRKPGALPELPVDVHLTRGSAGELDSHDGLPASMKAVADGVADVYQIQDRDPRIRFRYAQEKCPRGEYYVEIRITAQRGAA